MHKVRPEKYGKMCMSLQKARGLTVYEGRPFGGLAMVHYEGVMWGIIYNYQHPAGFVCVVQHFHGGIVTSVLLPRVDLSMSCISLAREHDAALSFISHIARTPAFRVDLVPWMTV